MARIFPEVSAKLAGKKRVSFGSTHGSMVETLIIDDMPNEERAFYQDTLLQHNNKHTLTSNREEQDMNSPPKIHVTFANNNNVDDLEQCATTTTTTTTTTKSETDSGVVIREAVETTFVTSEDNDVSFYDVDGDGGGGEIGGGGGGEERTTSSHHTTTSTTVRTITNNLPNSTEPVPIPEDPQVVQSSPTPRNATPSSVTFSDSVRTSGAPSPTSPTSSMASSITPGAGKKPGPPIIRLNRSPSTDSHENPFTADGELSKKAEYILRHSTISRSEIRISDPDLSKSADKSDNITEESPLVRQETVPVQSARPLEANPRENGKAEAPLTPQSVQVEVGTANASQPQPQQAEQVKLKDPKCKCCVIM